MNLASDLSDHLLAKAIHVKASDIHFEPNLQKTHIYFRVHGIRKFYKKIKKEDYHLLLAYYKFTSGMDIGNTRIPQNGTITFHHQSKSFHLRLSTLPVHSQESLAIRILPQEEHLSLKQLFIFPKQIKKLRKWISKRFGLIIISGPTGSGKTTTLYALLEDIVKSKSYQMITLEDPIEKKLDHILQVQINKEAGMSYSTGLKAALRHDPDLIMVGEIRDQETAHFALKAALTGHLVLSTLHAKDAIGTVHRLLDMGLKEVDLRQFLIAVGSMQLIPVEVDGKVVRRGAIMELLEEKSLLQVLKGGDPFVEGFQSFTHLQRKAYAYGFVSKKNFLVL